MQTQKDLYQAHRLMTQRLGLALLQGEPDLPESPMRRHNVATFAGILIAVLIVVGFGIWGLLKPGNATKLTDPGQLLVEEETGASYVYNQQQNKLQPVANYVSARLMLDSQDIKVRTVSAESLAPYARGQKVGIQGAPDSLPKRERLVKAPWSVCVVEGADAAGVRKPFVTLVGGIDVAGTPVGGSALVVNDGTQNWVLWNNQRMRAANVDRLTDQTPRRVPVSWINAIPSGVDFAAPPIIQRGKKAVGPGGRAARVGQVFKVESVAGAAERWYVLLADGLAPINQTQAMLLLQDPASKAAYGRLQVREIAIDAASANAAKASAQRIRDSGLPSTMPRFQTPGVSSPLCAAYQDTAKGSTRAVLTTGGRLRIPTPAASAGPDKVDQVLLPPGSAAVAGTLPGDGQLSAVQQFSLITDQGRRYRLATPDVLGNLGYDTTDVAPVPVGLLRLIPEGPALDPAAARMPVQEANLIQQPGTQ
ncbi:type VII secretion protein EccB [Nonomuraea jiangxiensis]|uniref:Type VII secretion protein EccB n=1 Tax=Nonomuraea jiangxiensis TaxID=633440 RepID=A0A1G8FIB8_9ACTN|nr:type VII secretion protein EccB [Nonomuraea jiangxiensis]SDH81894.1 type VII secretion protein EccB [Nonomuraea jiangxiensis]